MERDGTLPITYAPIDAVRFRSLMAGRVTDGEALYISAGAVAAGNAPPIPLPSAASDPGMPAVIAAFLAYRQGLFSEPPASDLPWQNEALDYDFSLGSPTAAQNLLLPAPISPGGHLDWYSFGMAAGRRKSGRHCESGATAQCHRGRGRRGPLRPAPPARAGRPARRRTRPTAATALSAAPARGPSLKDIL